MILLDTDHLTVLKYPVGERSIRLQTRMREADARQEIVGTTIIGVEEQMRGWLAAVAKERQPLRQVRPYQELVALFAFFRRFIIVTFDENAAVLFSQMNQINIRSTDRKAAAIALATNSVLVTANRRDFEQIPGLRFENWLD